MTFNMNLQDEPFKMINDGTKIIELRLNDEKRQKIKSGDIILFDNNYNDVVIECEVIKLHLFPNFKELYKAFDKISIGYREEEIPDPYDMEQYYSEENIKKYGVVGIEVKKIKTRKK